VLKNKLLQLLHFYLVVIRPVLEYAAPVWHHLITKTQTEQIETIKKRAIRIIYSYTYEMPYTIALYIAQISSLADHREQLSRVFFQLNPLAVMLFISNAPTST